MFMTTSPRSTVSASPGAPIVPMTAPQAATSAADVELSLVTSRAAFDALEAEWNALFERAGKDTQVFQTFNWNWHWANTYLSGSDGGIDGLKLSIVTGRRDGKLIMVWPLVSERVRGITQIFWMGEPVSQYGDVVIDDIADALDVMRAGWEFLKAHAKGDVLRLRRVRADAAVAALLKEIGARVADRLTAPCIDLSSAPSFAKYEERYSSHARRNRRRLRRRLEERAPLTYERHYGGAEARALAIKALELKAEWLKSKGLISHAISDPRMTRFFADAAGGESHSTNCIVSTLKSNGEPAALEVAFTCKGRLVMHVIVYDLKFEKAGAGVLLMENCIADGYTDKLAVYDMLAPGDNYKLDWADASVEVCDWVKPLSAAGYAYARLYLGLLRPYAKQAMTSMPQSLRRIVSRSYALSIT
jgi:CelD/BcsL family acetyltransferase involved in cellulose biosynthesis